MQPLNQTKTDSFLLDCAFVNNQIYLLDAKANLYSAGADGKILRKRQILKQPPTSTLASWSAMLTNNGEAALLSKNTIRHFWFIKATNQQKFSPTHHPIKIAATSEKFVACIDEAGFLTITSLLSFDLYFLANELFFAPTALFFSADNRWLLVATSNNEIYIYDLLTYKMVVNFTTAATIDGGAFLGGGRLVLTGAQKDLYFYSWHAKGSMLNHISLAKVRLKAVLKSENFLFVGLSSGALAIVDLEKMEIFRILEMLSESVVFLKLVGSFVVAGGSDGELAIYDASKDHQKIKDAIKNGEFLQIKQSIESNYFLLSSGDLVEFLENFWEETILPNVIKLIENGEAKRAVEVSSSFLCDVAKTKLVKTLLSLKDQIADLKRSLHAKEYDKVEDILSMHPMLKMTNSGKIYSQEWFDCYNKALDLLGASNQVDAKKMLHNFAQAGKKMNAIKNLMLFSKLFIEARQKLNNNNIKGFFDDVSKHTILSTMPHYDLIIQKGKQLEKDLCRYALRYDYNNELVVAKELLRYAPFAIKAKIEIDRLRVEFTFQDLIAKNNFSKALDLASEYIYLLDSSSFVVLYLPYQKRLSYAKEVADGGDIDGLRLLLDEFLKNSILRDSALFILRIAYGNEIRSVVMQGVINWRNTFNNYTKLLGCDLMIQQLAIELGVEKHLDEFLGRKNLRTLDSGRSVESIMNYDPINIPTTTSTSLLEKVLYVSIVLIVLLATLFVFATVIEKPLQDYRDEAKRESPYKLFEKVSKEKSGNW